MFVRHPSSPRRSGVILLVVMSLLALFAALGLAFLYYADSESDISTNSVKGASAQIEDVDPEMLLAFYLNQLIYGVGDAYAQNGTLPLSPYAANSAMRGHDLGRNMFGYNVLSPNPATYPYSGVGKMPPVTGAAAPFQFITPSGQTFFFKDMPNMTHFPADGFIIDPERAGPLRTGPTQPLSTNYVGWNVSYSYPDQNNPFLGTINANGEILAPSWWRYWDSFASIAQPAGGPPTLNPMDPSNPFWSGTSPMYKYMTLRPHPSAHPYFPLPADGGGDVKCVDVGPGLRNPGVAPGQPNSYFANDSIWMDLGFPFLTGPNGRKYKPLFASFITDMDSKINVNAHGNVRALLAGSPVHASNQGLGPWEINPAWVLSGGDYPNLFLGNAAAVGRYGLSGVPDIAGASASNYIALTTGALPNSLAPYWQHALDLDMVRNDGSFAQSTKYRLPGEFGNGASPYFGFVNYAAPNVYSTYGSSTFAAAEMLSHPGLFNVFNPGYFAPKSTNVNYPDSTVESLYRTLSTGSAAMTPRLFRVCPTSLSDPTGRTMRLLTPRSFDVGMPGAMPWLTGPSGYAIQQPAGPTVPPYPVGAATAFNPPTPLNPQPSGEFAPLTANGQVTSYAWSMLRKINLNRPLTPYPGPVASGGTGQITNISQYQQAVKDRQALAQDIFNVFVQTTMGVPLGSNNQPNWPAGSPGLPGSGGYQATVWLAQLSVNIVDYIDTDNYVTPFNWNPADPVNGWVYGTELPRLLLNEFYCEVDNAAADLTGPMATQPYQVNMWVELINTITSDPNIVDVQTPGTTGAVRLQMPAGNGFASYPIYQLTVTQGGPWSANPVPPQGGGPGLGTPTTSITVVNSFAGQQLVYPPSPPPGDYSGVGLANTPGFYVVGPPNALIGASYRTNSMQYPLAVNTLALPTSNNFTLARLACPDLPPQPIANPALWPNNQPYFNPYVTVDYAANVPVNDGRLYNQTGVNTPTANPQSVGRKQPLAGALLVNQNPIPKLASSPRHTFFRQNGQESTVPPTGLNTTASQTLTVPFNWLVHPDRQITSPVELLHVSQYPPYMLTQKFMGAGAPSPNSFGHTSMSAWFDSSARIFRAMEFFEMGIRSPGIPATATANINTTTGQVTSVTVTNGGAGYSPTNPPPVAIGGGGGTGAVATAKVQIGPGGTGTVTSVTIPVGSGGSGYTSPPTVTIAPAHDAYGSSILLSGRIPGKINLNTYWDLEILLALTDPQTNLSLFSQANVQALHAQLLASRSPTGIPGPTDRPFYGMGGNAVGTLGAVGPTVDDTFFRGNPMGQGSPVLQPGGSRMFSIRPPVNVVTGGNPAVPGALNVNPTTPGSSFLSEGAPPFTKMELLSKIYNNATTRSNVFAVWLTVGFFDVTDGPLSDPSLVSDTNPAGAVTSTNLVNNAGGSSTVTAPLLSGKIVGVPWKIAPGVTLWIGSGSNTEPVTVASVNAAAGTFTVTFANNHAAGEPIAMKGVLGQEVGIASGSNVRHRMFAMVDRSALSIPANLTTTNALISASVQQPAAGQIVMPPLPPMLPGVAYAQTVTLPTPPAGFVLTVPPLPLNLGSGLTATVALGGTVLVAGLNPAPANSGSTSFTVTFTNGAQNLVYFYSIPLAVQVSVAQLQGVANVSEPVNGGPYGSPSINVNYPWQIQNLMSLTIDPNTTVAENIQVLAVNPGAGTITAVFNNPHSAGAVVALPGQAGVVPGSIMGNPGPQQRFDHRLNTALVPHYSIIR